MSEVALVLVPVEPTEAMLRAYRGAIKKLIASESNPKERWPIKGRRVNRGYKVREEEKAIARWKAMVQAAQIELTQGV